MEVLLSLIKGNWMGIFGGLAGASALGWILSTVFPKFFSSKNMQGWADSIDAFFVGAANKTEIIVTTLAKGVGVAITAGMSKWAGKVWNKTLEPLIFLFMDIVLSRIVFGIILVIQKAFNAIPRGLTDGMESDNTPDITGP